MKGNVRHILDQVLARDIVDNDEVRGWFTDEAAAYLTDDLIDRERAYLQWHTDNPVLNRPSLEDLPRHRRPGPIVITCDDAQDRAYSYDAEQRAAADGRTVWAGHGTGWVSA